MRYAKALVAVLVAVLTVVASALTDGVVADVEKIEIGIALATAAGVWLAPNLPGEPHIKTGIAAVLAALNLATTLITGGITPAETVNLALAALGVLMVGVVPNRGDAADTRVLPRRADG